MAVSTMGIIDDVAKILNDTEFDYWKVEDHLAALNAGMTALVILKPDATATAKEYQLSEGSRQSLPDGSALFTDAQGATLPKATKLVRVIRNMGTDGLTPGRAVAIIDMDLLNAVRPDWHNSTPNAEAKHFMYDEKAPKLFWVYPPQPAANQGFVEVIYNAIPTPVTRYATDEYITLSDEYREALTYFVLFKAYSRDTDSANANKALQYYDAFKVALGLHQGGETNEDPNYKDTEASPSYERR